MVVVFQVAQLLKDIIRHGLVDHGAGGDGDVGFCLLHDE